jgi:polysaccharide deacetylase family protein (PEP-CTERM system associated)
MSTKPNGILSVDVEDYFQVEAFSDIVKRESWGNYACRVENNTRRVLDLLDECGCRATFFFLGWVAAKFPALVAEIVHRGHEPAVHSYWHRLVYSLSLEEFRQDTLQAKDAIEQAAGVSVAGYRAPSYSVTTASLWALDILAELGFRYDSSIFPIRHDVYGIPGAPRGPFRWGNLVEFPITTFRLRIGPNLPVAGGGYLRLLPFAYTRFGVRRVAAEGLPVISYFHPWEIDPEQPRFEGRAKSRLRHYTNLDRMQARIRRLCRAVDFQTFAARLAEMDTARLPEWVRPR